MRGVGLVCLASGVIRPPEPDLAARLAHIHAGVDALIIEWKPDTIGLESVFSARSARSALVLGQARGAALAACARTGLPICEYAPTQVKTAVAGHGQAGKAQVQRMVQMLLDLQRPPAQDAADALAIAICHVRRRETLALLERASRSPS